MPSLEKSKRATSCRTSAGNLIRSIGHHAPEAPNPSTVCAATALIRATRRPVGVATGAAVVVVVLPVPFAEFDDEQAATPSATTTKNVRTTPVPQRVRIR